MSDIEALPERSAYANNTGIYVRAKCAGKWGAHDISELSEDSLLAWVRADGGCNAKAENTLLALFGHRQIATQSATLASQPGCELDDSGPVFSGRVIRFDNLAEKLLPIAEKGRNCAGPQDWRLKEAIRAVLCHLFPAAPQPAKEG